VIESGGSAIERRDVRVRAVPPSRAVLGIASLGFFLAFLDATIVNIAFPDIALSFPETSLGGLSWILNGYNVIFAAFLLPFGRLADVFGRRRIFLAGLAVFTAGSLLCAITWSVEFLVAFRVVQAMGAAAMVPAGLALVLHGYEIGQRSHAVALISAIGALAAGLGPAIGGFLIALADWRLVFLVNLPVGVAAYLLASRRLVESREAGRRRLPDMPGAAIFALAIAALVIGIVNGADWGWTSPAVIVAFAASCLGLVVFVRRSRRHRAPVLESRLFANRTFSVANALSVIGAAGFFGYTLLNVLFLTGVWDYSVLQAGLAITPGPFVAAAIAGPTSRLALRIGYRPVVTIGGLIWGAGVLWLVARVGPEPAYVSEWLPGLVLLGLGAGITFPNVSAAAVASAPGESFATATGVSSVVRQVGAAIGVALAVAILGTPATLEEATTAFDNAWLFAAGCLITAGIGGLAIGTVAPGQAGARVPALADAMRVALAPPHVRSFEPKPARAAQGPLPVPPPQSGSSRESLADFLARVPLFAALDAELLAEVADTATELRVSAGEWVFREGDAGDAMYVVRAGRIEVVDGEGRVIRELGKGAAVGELALITGETRAASIRAARDCELVQIGQASFQRLLDSSLELSRALNLQLARQLAESEGVKFAARPLASTITLLAIGDSDLAGDLAAELTDELRRFTPAERLPEVDAGGNGDAAVFGPLLDRAEAEAGLVVLAAGPRSTAGWRRFCIQQADRILAVAAPGDEIDGELDPALHEADLVACDVQPGSGALAGLSDAIEPIEHHLIRDGERAADVARLARRLTGRSVGLVLSGGGARAFAHIGVIEQLEAAGIVVDRVAGVSMGAFIGGMYAAGLDAEEIDAISYENWVLNYPLNDWRLPRHAMILGQRFAEMLQGVFGEVRFEELERSFFCASADLRRSELVVHRHGKLWEHIGTSMCLPVLAPPQVRGERLLIDGGLIDNLPVAAMAELGEGPVIAVDIRAGDGSSSRKSRGNGIGPADAAEPGLPDRPPPGLGETLGRLFLLASSNTAQASRKHANLVIEPRSPGVGLLEFHQIDAAVEAGRQATSAALEAAPAELFSGASPP
jgi:EmrB/QacA subfamily drug resistance transporter